MKTRTKTRLRSRENAPIDLDEVYLRAIQRLESLPENQSGAEKSWVERTLRSWRAHYARAVRVR